MNFIHSDTFLPVFFCNFIKMLTTSDWNANDCISETVVFVFFVLFFFSLQNADRVLHVTCNVTHCVVQKHASSSTKSMFYSGRQKDNC